MEKRIINGKEVEVIDVTPTWEGMLPYYLLVLEQGTVDGKKLVKAELLNMARLADMATKWIKEEQSKPCDPKPD